MKRRWYFLPCYCFFTVSHDFWVCLSFLRQWTFILWNVGNIRSNVRKNTSIIFATLLPHPLFYAICEQTTGNLKITLNLLGIFAHVVESVSWAYPLFYSWIVGWKKIFILSSLDCCKFYRRIDRLSFLCIWIIFQWSCYLSFIYAFELYYYLSREDRFLLTNVYIYYKISESFIDKKPYINMLLLEEAECRLYNRWIWNLFLLCCWFLV